MEHPRLGEISPAQFIPLAEETGLIVPIGEWAFMTACREGKALQDELGMDLTVSVNLSPRQFQQRNLVQVIENSLAESGLAARNLEIEITENMLMVNSGGNLDKLQKIRELGARISIDDFGTGFLQLLVPAAVPGGPAEDRPELCEAGRNGSQRRRSCEDDHRDVARTQHPGGRRGRGDRRPIAVSGTQKVR